MFYYITYQKHSLALIKSSSAEFIETFVEKVNTSDGIYNKYFYNRTDSLIYCYDADGQHTPTSKCKYSSEEAERILLERALLNSQNHIGKSILFPPTDNPISLITEIEDYLENNDEDNNTIITALSDIIYQLQQNNQ